MSEASAQSAIVLSAFTIAAIYGWRWLTGSKPNEKLSLESLVGYRRPLTSPEGFILAWGLAFTMLAGVSAFAPTLAGAFALLLLFGDVLANMAGAAETAVKLQAAKTETPAKKAGKK